MGTRWLVRPRSSSSQETRVRPSQLEFCQLCVPSKQSLNVSKESVKAAEREPEREGLNYLGVAELPELD